MPTRLSTANKVVGTRRLLKAIDDGQIAIAYIALDADLFISRQVTGRCQSADIPLIEVNSMKELGEACGVQVSTASAGIKKA